MKLRQTRRGDHPRIKELGGVHAKEKNGKIVHLGPNWAENVQKAKEKKKKKKIGNGCKVATNRRRKSKMKKSEEKPQVSHSEAESSAVCA